MLVDNHLSAFDQLFVIIAGLVFALWALSLTYFDLTQRRLPDNLTLPAIPIMLMWALMGGHLLVAAIGALLWWLLYLGAALVAPAAYGGGDIKLAATLGGIAAATGGATGWFVATIAAGVVTGVAGLIVALRGYSGTSRDPSDSLSLRVPHGPGMLLGTSAAVVLGVTWV